MRPLAGYVALMRVTSWWTASEARRVIPAAPEDVFAVLVDPWTYPDWLLGTQEIRAVDADWPRPGSAFHHSVGPLDDVTVDDISEVVTADPPRSLTLRVHVGHFRGIVELVVVPASCQSACEVRFRERPAGLARHAMPILRPLIYSRSTASLRRLEALLRGPRDLDPSRNTTAITQARQRGRSSVGPWRGR